MINTLLTAEINLLLKNGGEQRGTCIKGLIWPPLEPKSESCFSQISSGWFIRRITQMSENSGICLNLMVAMVT